MTSGSQAVAVTLRSLGVTCVFGLVGIPVVEVAEALAAEGIRFLAFRNEQAASYAALAYGYLTGRPGVLLVVGGPGIVHAMAGVFNSQLNRWPLLVLAGSSSHDEVGRGGFQELDQVSYTRSEVKWAGRALQVADVPRVVEQAWRHAWYGTPGVGYVDLPADVIQGSSSVPLQAVRAHPPPRTLADPARVAAAAAVLRQAKRPLVVVGKGAAHASAEVTALVGHANLAFLPTPMGKGVVADSHRLNFSSARLTVLAEADVVVVLGARLNWILHHGDAPRWSPDATFIVVDLKAEEVGQNRDGEYGLVGDIGLVAGQLSEALGASRFEPPAHWHEIRERNENKLSVKETTATAPNALLGYNRVYGLIKEAFGKDYARTTLVTEGANTMDIARILFPSELPRRRLDAGTNATMGLSLGYAAAVLVALPDTIPLVVVGDSAVGFLAMELDTLVRNRLASVVVVMNNSGVYHGEEDGVYSGTVLPATALGLDTKYHDLCRALGGEGVEVRTEAELVSAVGLARANHAQGKTTVVNVIIERGIGKKIGFGWQNKKGKAKL